MVDKHVLDIVMLAEVGLLVLAVGLFFAHGMWLFLRERRLLRLTTGARTALSHLITRGAINVQDIEALRKLPPDVQVITFLEIARTLSGTGKDKLRFVAQEVGMLDRARKLCESRLWQRRLRGARILSQMDVADPLILRLLADSRPAVRAQAAEWAAAQPSPGVISAMLKLLADPSTQARFSVQNALLRMGGIIAGPLTVFLETHSGRAAEAGLRVAEAVAEPAFGPVALSLSRTESIAVRIAAANLLGAIGDGAAAERLNELLRDQDAGVRAAAAHALGRMQHWKSASLLAECLRDRVWGVRRAAGLALRALGAPGALFLRRATNGDDRFAADMAQQVLDLPAAAG